MPTITPSITANAEGNIRASTSLAASATANYDRDYSDKISTTITVEVIPGGTVSATHGLLVEVFRRYGTGPTTQATPDTPYTIAPLVASTTKDKSFELGPGKYNIKITNLDASQAVTVEITDATLVLVSA